MMCLKMWRWLVVLALMSSPAIALTVKDVTVSATADSLETARTQALDKAHTLAFKKLQEEYYPDVPQRVPPLETLEDMVQDFSVDIEKPSSDNKTYAASLTFTFYDEPVAAWFQERTSAAPTPSGKPLNVAISYTALVEWNGIKRALEAVPGGQSMRILSLTSHTAEVELPYGGDGTRLQQTLEKKGIHLGSQQGKWVIPADAVALSLEVY